MLQRRSLYLDENADASKAIFKPRPENWRRPPGLPRTTWMKNIHDDLSSLDLAMHEARDLTQNRHLTNNTHFYLIFFSIAVCGTAVFRGVRQPLQPAVQMTSLKASSHRHAGHDTDTTVSSRLVWRCELSRPDRQTGAFCVCVAVCRAARSPYSIAERRVPELIPVLGSQPAGDVRHKPGGRLPLFSVRPACSYPRNP